MIKKTTLFFGSASDSLFLTWMSMIMAFIATLILAAGLVSYATLADWERSVSGAITVQIPTYDREGNPRGDVIQGDVETALMILRTSEGIKGASVLDDAHMSRLMQPWLAPDTVIQELPLPQLIDVEIDPTTPPNLAQIQADLAEQVPHAVLDSHRFWLDTLVRLAHNMLKMIGFILVLLALTTSFTVIYATRTGLSVHEPVINLVHMMGANDFFIINQYAWHSMKQTFLGAVFGFLLAIPLIAGVSFFLRSFAENTSISLILTPMHWGILASIPVILAAIGFITAYKTVGYYLKRFL